VLVAVVTVDTKDGSIDPAAYKLIEHLHRVGEQSRQREANSKS
jgi:hypothetical protein